MTYISDSYRSIISERANYSCEYCRASESNTFYSFQVDHIISLKHGGETSLDNLAYACPICNRAKGSDLGTILIKGGPIVRFFNPRTDVWTDHFRIREDGLLLPNSSEGEATIKILNMNHLDSLIERALLLSLGLFPKS